MKEEFKKKLKESKLYKKLVTNKGYMKLVGAIVGITMMASAITFTLSACNKKGSEGPGTSVVTPVDPTPTPDPTPNPGPGPNPGPNPGPGPDPGPIIDDEDQDVTEEDVAAFEAELQNKIGAASVEYEIIDGQFYCYGKSKDNDDVTLYKFELSEKAGMEKVSQLKALTSDMEKISDVFTISSEKNYLEYSGKKYNLSAIKGENIFAEKVGRNTAQGITVVNYENNGNKANMNIFVVTGTDTVMAKVSTETTNSMTEAEVISGLLNEIAVPETIAFGTDTFKIATAETPTNVEPPAPVELNYTALEEKIADVVAQKYRKTELKEIYGYSLKDGYLNVLGMAGSTKNSTIVPLLFKFGVDKDIIETQEDIESIIDQVSLDNYTEVLNFTLAQNDITIDGETYSKNGITGDNIFAQQCGIENAEMTFFGDLGNDTYADTATGYGRGLYIMVVSRDENGNIKIDKKQFVIESDTGYTMDQIYSNFQNESKRYVYNEESYEIGSLTGGSLSDKTNVEQKELQK